MKQVDNSQPAFPAGVSSVKDAFEMNAAGMAGMSLRDYFAAKAIQGLVSCEPFHSYLYEQDPILLPRAASFAYQIADAMLIARSANGS